MLCHHVLIQSGLCEKIVVTEVAGEHFAVGVVPLKVATKVAGRDFLSACVARGVH